MLTFVNTINKTKREKMNKESGDVNQIILVGTISNVFPTNQTDKGTKYTNFVIKMTEKNTNGYEKTTTVMCCKFGDFDFSADSRVSIEGKLSNKKNADGDYRLSVVVLQMKLIGEPKKSSNSFIGDKPPLGDCPF